MTLGCCVTNALAKLAIGGTRLQFIEFDPYRVMRTLSDANGNAILGTLDRDPDLVAPGIEYDQFRISLYMTAQNMNVLLPIMGFTQSGNVWTLGNPMPSTEIILGINSVPEATWVDSVCAKWVARGQKGGDPPRIDLWFRAPQRGEQAVNTFFVSDTDPARLTEFAYAFNGGTVMTYSGNTYGFNQYALGLDTMQVAEYMNSTFATYLCPTDHVISIGAGMLYAPCAGTVTNLVTTPFTGDITGGAFSLAFSRTIGMTTYSTTFNLPMVKQIPMQPAVTRKHDFTRLQFHGVGYSNGTAPSMRVTNNYA